MRRQGSPASTAVSKSRRPGSSTRASAGTGLPLMCRFGTATSSRLQGRRLEWMCWSSRTSFKCFEGDDRMPFALPTLLLAPPYIPPFSYFFFPSASSLFPSFLPCFSHYPTFLPSVSFFHLHRTSLSPSCPSPASLSDPQPPLRMPSSVARPPARPLTPALPTCRCVHYGSTKFACVRLAMVTDPPCPDVSP